jgi:hypothetical protein
MSGITINDLLIDAFNKLDLYFQNSKESSESNSVSASLSAAYLTIKAKLTGKVDVVEKTTSKRVVDFPITPQTLAQFIGASNNCWIIEDFHKIESDEKLKMSQIMKVFMDQSADYPNLKIIAIGAVNSAREVVRYDPELRDRIMEIEIPLMGIEDLKSILNKGQDLLNIYIDDKIIERIARNSCGLPIVTHDLAYLLCDVSDVKKTYNSNQRFEIPNKSYDLAVDEYIYQNSDSYKLIYETATKITHKRTHDNPLDIITAILNTNNDSVTLDEITSQLRKKYPNYKNENLEKHVSELTTSSRYEILRLNKDSMSYFFSNPFIKAYFRCMHTSGSNSSVLKTLDIIRELKESTMGELESARLSFIEDLDFTTIDDETDFSDFD